MGKAKASNLDGTVAYNCRTPVSPLEIKKLLRDNYQDIFHEPEASFPSMQLLLATNGYNFVTIHIHREPNWKYNLFASLRFPYGRIITGRICVSKTAYQFAKRYFPGKYKIIPKGIDCKIFTNEKSKIKKFCDGKFNILYVGRLEERKGLNYLLEAFKLIQAKNKKIRLIIVGEGNLKQQYREYTRRNFVKNVNFEGEVKESQLASYYNTSDLFCSPAIYGESFGIVLLEAMASGLQAIAGDNAGYKTIIKNGKNGILVNPKKTGLVCQKINYLIENETIRNKLKANGLKKALTYDWRVIGKRIVNYYLDCIKEKNSKKANNIIFNQKYINLNLIKKFNGSNLTKYFSNKL